MGYVASVEVGWSGDLLIADCEDLENCQPPIFTSNGSSIAESHKKESCCTHVLTHLSNFSIFLDSHAARCPPVETLSKLTETFFDEEKR